MQKRIDEACKAGSELEEKIVILNQNLEAKNAEVKSKG